MLRLRSFDSAHFSSYSALSCYGLFVQLAFWRLLFSMQSLLRSASAASWFPAMLPSLGGGRVTTYSLYQLIYIKNFGE